MELRKVVALITVLVGCEGGSKSSVAERFKHSTGKTTDSTTATRTRMLGMDDGFVDRTITLSDGAAYVTELDNGVWYIRGDRAQRVRVVGPGLAQDSAIFQNAVDFQIAPTPDGRAYASSAFNKAVWLLVGAEARRVREGPITDSVPRSSLIPNSAPFWFAAFSRASADEKRCGDQLQEEENQHNDDAIPDRDPPEYDQ